MKELNETNFEVQYRCKSKQWIGIIHLVRMQNFPENQHFLPRDTHTYVRVSKDKKCWFSGNFCVSTKWMIPYPFLKTFRVFNPYQANIIWKPDWFVHEKNILIWVKNGPLYFLQSFALDVGDVPLDVLHF